MSDPTGKLPENNKVKGIPKTEYDDYERNTDNLKLHWPIMRNHIYRFYVGGSGPEQPEITVKVSDWGYEKIVYDW